MNIDQLVQDIKNGLIVNPNDLLALASELKDYRYALKKEQNAHYDTQIELKLIKISDKNGFSNASLQA